MDNNGPPRPSRCRGGGGAGTDRGSPGPPGPWQGPPGPPRPSSVNARVPPSTHRAQNQGPEAHGLEGLGQAGLSRSLCLLEIPGRLLGSLSRAGAGVQGCRSGWAGRVGPRLPSDALETLLHSKITPHRHPSGESVPSLQMEGVGLPAGCLFPKPLSHFVFMGSLSQMPVHTRCSRWSPTPLSTSPAQGSPHPSSSPLSPSPLQRPHPSQDP